MAVVDAAAAKFVAATDKRRTAGEIVPTNFDSFGMARFRASWLGMDLKVVDDPTDSAIWTWTIRTKVGLQGEK